MCEGTRLYVVEPVPVPDTMITQLVGVERFGSIYRFTYGVPRGPLWETGRELVVSARLVVPAPLCRGLIDQAAQHLARLEADSLPPEWNHLPA